KALKEAGVKSIIADTNWRRLRPARESGLETFFGEVLSEDAEVRLDHSAFETVLALSANEPYNALVSSHFAPELGRHRVFQLSAQDGEDEDPRSMGASSRGRTLVKRGRGYDQLIRDHYRGWVFSKTQLTEKYTLDNLRNDRSQADMIAEVRPDGAVSFLESGSDPRGSEGATLIMFGPTVPKESNQEAASGSGEIEGKPIVT
ncbi:MAG: sodium:proton antiporter, partial [Pseudomonadota bacterium]